MAVIIDLDQPLIDSSKAEYLRKARDWNAVYGMIPSLSPYLGITDLLAEFNSLKLPVCIVTSSPESYCKKVISHWGWKVDATVCYHDTAKHKPYPEPILLGLSKLNVSASEAVAVGDAAKDTQAAKAAKVLPIGALWGSLEKQQLSASQPSILCETVNDLRDVLFEKFELG